MAAPATAVNTDVFGEIGVDGTGTAWEYTGGTVKRTASVTTPTASFNVTEWEFYPGVDDAIPFSRY